MKETKETKVLKLPKRITPSLFATLCKVTKQSINSKINKNDPTTGKPFFTTVISEESGKRVICCDAKAISYYKTKTSKRAKCN